MLNALSVASDGSPYYVLTAGLVQVKHLLDFFMDDSVYARSEKTADQRLVKEESGRDEELCAAPRRKAMSQQHTICGEYCKTMWYLKSSAAF